MKPLIKKAEGWWWVYGYTYHDYGSYQTTSRFLTWSEALKVALSDYQPEFYY